MKEFDVEEMEKGNGKEGKPVYVAHRGKVYDVTGSKMWKGGVHMNRHHAGKDLTTDIQAAPHDPSVLERYPQVGTLKEPGPSERELPEVLSRLLARAPFLRRHPHPMTIHFPIVFTFATLVFNVLYLILGINAFEITALNCLGAAIFFTPVAIATGFYTWWLNYQAKPIRPVILKQRLSFLLLGAEIFAFVWRLKDPHIFDSFGWSSTLYFLLILFMFIVVFVIGWFGANLTFPIERWNDDDGKSQ
jgi:predicted heme/steroid binding protein/uncharacterized membrane protein